MRHLAIGNGPIVRLNDLRSPMESIIATFASQLAELQRYKERFGDIEESEDGSETEHE